MSKGYKDIEILKAIVAASALLSSRKEEINRLNVFPVPDGDTGTNMSLTLESVVSNIQALPNDASSSDTMHAIITGALMGARGNSGVITSQILRGLCEGAQGFERLDVEALDGAFKRAVEVAFQAVRKPVEGTILTVLLDASRAASKALEDGLDTDAAMDAIVDEAYASVERTPDFLPVLRENNVVDAGGFGLAILFDGFNSAIQGKQGSIGAALSIGAAEPKVEIEHIEDWEGSEYRYCNEFLVDSDTLDPADALDFLSTMGDCELCVGTAPKFKVHVHSNHPDQVLKYFLDRGQVFEVFIHNMDLQSKDRMRKIASEEAAVEGDMGVQGSNEPAKPIGFVAVAPGEGNAEILKSLGVDVVVSGGQTMNPSTKDLVDAIEKVPSGNVIILPNNSNIIMAANSACELSSKTCAVVPTKSVPQAFSAMFAFDPDLPITDNAQIMMDAASEVRTGEITVAIKNSRDAHKNKIRKGDFIGIADGSIEVVGKDVNEVALGLIEVMDAQDADNLTILAGVDYSDIELNGLVGLVEDAWPELEIDPHRGGQPLYPVILSLE